MKCLDGLLYIFLLCLEPSAYGRMVPRPGIGILMRNCGVAGCSVVTDGLNPKRTVRFIFQPVEPAGNSGAFHRGVTYSGERLAIGKIYTLTREDKHRMAGWQLIGTIKGVGLRGVG